MIVTVVSMPEGVGTRTDVEEARRLLATARCLFVDVELPVRESAQGPEATEPVARLLGLGAEEADWFGQPGEPTRADLLEGVLGLVMPVSDGDQIGYVHVLASERFLVTAHRGPTALTAEVTEHLRREKPRDAVAMLFLPLQEALATFRRATVAALLEVEELEDDMFRQRTPEQVYLLARVRRRAALLHRSLLPYLQAVDEVVTRRMLSPHFPEDRQRLARDFQHAARMVLTTVESLQDAARRTFASYSSLVAGEQNGVINRLAIVSVIFLPLSFLTGFFGMNFTFLTDKLESRDEFWLLAVGLQAAVLFGSLYVLHRTRIWRRLRDDD
ncbi:CorA family divalent cation transporter [Streptomyces sp. NPDC048362]|uniref:magnesium transporter CorA family protein n=1 Tax=Streptomyces sp. NPDC048362 TaxID=3365539 RepID=UPI003722379B